MMLSQLGKHHNWWQAGGFVFEDQAPADEESAWMVACSYIKGSELEAEDDSAGGNQGGNSQSGNNQGGSSQNGSNSNPKTADISVMWAVIAIAMAGASLVVLKKKEAFFLN